MNRKRRLVIMVIVAAAVLFLASSCTTSTNRQPIITSLEAEAERTTPSSSLQVMCSASDPDGDQLGYIWSASTGEISGDGDTVTWAAPLSEGSYSVAVMVTDGRGGEVTDYVTVAVRVNKPPIISSLVAGADWTTPSGTIQVTCTASDPDGAELSHEWSASGGSITGTGAAVNWTAPGQVGMYNITVVVTDSQGEEDTGLIYLSVSNDPPLWGEIIPEEGTVTSYGIPLSLENTQQFINWYNSITLSAEEQATRDVALSSLVAPCCDEYPMSTCCCECNLARSVWGLSAYLIAEKGYGVNLVQEAASQWLHFIRPDYYVGRALVEEGIDPNRWGFTIESSCFAGHCNRPFYTKTSSSHLGGCGGMNELIQVEQN